MLPSGLPGTSGKAPTGGRILHSPKPRVYLAREVSLMMLIVENVPREYVYLLQSLEALSNGELYSHLG